MTDMARRQITYVHIWYTVYDIPGPLVIVFRFEFLTKILILFRIFGPKFKPYFGFISPQIQNAVCM